MIKKLYKYIINILSKHKLPALFLSHGGLHLIVLLICIVAAIFMYGEIDRYNQRVLRQFTFRIDSDTMENYKLSHLEVYVFRDTEDTLNDDIRYMFQLGYKDSSNYKIPSFFLLFVYSPSLSLPVSGWPIKNDFAFIRFFPSSCNSSITTAPSEQAIVSGSVAITEPASPFPLPKEVR